MRVFRLERGPRLADALLPLPPKSRSESIGNLRYVGSGKAAIALILAYLAGMKRLPNKMSPLLMPQWLGTWVYAQTLPFGFPTTDPTAAAPVVFVYHQYGFPQNMEKILSIAEDRRMTVIEDCAHAIDSDYKGRKLGTFGEFAFFSYSKFIFCFALGGVRGADEEFGAFIDANVRSKSLGLQLLVNAFKFVDEWHFNRVRPPAPALFDGTRKMAYARYGEQLRPGRRAVGLWEAKREDEIRMRRANYAILRDNVDRFGICDHLERDSVTPYAVPLAIDSRHAAAVVQKLGERGLKAGLYQFDFNRCVFEPAFRPCVLVPIHSGLQGEGMAILVDTLVSML